MSNYASVLVDEYHIAEHEREHNRELVERCGSDPDLLRLLGHKAHICEEVIVSAAQGSISKAIRAAYAKSSICGPIECHGILRALGENPLNVVAGVITCFTMVWLVIRLKNIDISTTTTPPYPTSMHNAIEAFPHQIPAEPLRLRNMATSRSRSPTPRRDPPIQLASLTDDDEYSATDEAHEFESDMPVFFVKTPLRERVAWGWDGDNE